MVKCPQTFVHIVYDWLACLDNTSVCSLVICSHGSGNKCQITSLGPLLSLGLKQCNSGLHSNSGSQQNFPVCDFPISLSVLWKVGAFVLLLSTSSSFSVSALRHHWQTSFGILYLCKVRIRFLLWIKMEGSRDEKTDLLSRTNSLNWIQCNCTNPQSHASVM